MVRWKNIFSNDIFWTNISSNLPPSRLPAIRRSILAARNFQELYDAVGKLASLVKKESSLINKIMTDIFNMSPPEYAHDTPQQPNAPMIDEETYASLHSQVALQQLPSAPPLDEETRNLLFEENKQKERALIEKGQVDIWKSLLLRDELFSHAEKLQKGSIFSTAAQVIKKNPIYTLSFTDIKKLIANASTFNHLYYAVDELKRSNKNKSLSELIGDIRKCIADKKPPSEEIQNDFCNKLGINLYPTDEMPASQLEPLQMEVQVSQPQMDNHEISGEYNDFLKFNPKQIQSPDFREQSISGQYSEYLKPHALASSETSQPPHDAKSVNPLSEGSGETQQVENEGELQKAIKKEQENIPEQPGKDKILEKLLDMARLLLIESEQLKEKSHLLPFEKSRTDLSQFAKYLDSLLQNTEKVQLDLEEVKKNIRNCRYAFDLFRKVIEKKDKTIHTKMFSSTADLKELEGICVPDEKITTEQEVVIKKTKKGLEKG
ncbi:hypothetical protein [Aquicella lusitana]|nr:hypothetical protein [Aquicella lusitana]